MIGTYADILFETHLIFAHTYSIVLMYCAGIFHDAFYLSYKHLLAFILSQTFTGREGIKFLTSQL